MNMEKPIKLFTDGSDGETSVAFGEDGVLYTVKTIISGSLSTKRWTSEEIIGLLNDGRKYRLLKRAEEIKSKILSE